MKFLQFAVGTVERAVTAGFADNMIASYSKAIQKTVSVVQRKDILLSPVISEIRYDFPQASLTKDYEVREAVFVSTFPKISHVTSSVFKGVGVRHYSTGAYCSEQKIEDLKHNNKGAISYKIQKPIKVVFDLDYVLVSNICLVDSKPNNFDKILQNVGEDSVIESCGYYFYLYNGWKELIKYVMELSDNDLIFFSSGARERNEDIIPKMLERVLERDPTEYMRNNVKIFSREHTIDTTEMSYAEKEKFQPKGMWGQKKKDLTVAVGSEKLKYTLLIDDDETYIIPGQEKNLLRIDGKSAVYNLYNCIKISQDQKILLENITQYESFRTFNKLFYAAGVLRDVCDTYSKVDRDLVDIMWEDHGFKVEPKHSGFNYEISSQSYELLKRFELYQSGLELLGEINSDVGFLMSPSEI
jgi:hypothetical protein